MNIAININCQFMRMTGVQFYVDSLLNALYAVNTEHQITAFAPALWSPEMWREWEKDGLFAWRRHPQARVDTAGSDFRLQDISCVAAQSRWRASAARLDDVLVRRVKGRTVARRTRRASRRYDVMHLPAGELRKTFDSQARRCVATIYDLTTRTHPWAHQPANIQAAEYFLAHVKRHCARVLTISEFSKADIVERLGIADDRVDVTPLAGRLSTQRVEDPTAIGETLRDLGLAETPFVLYTGTLEPRKNLRRLVEAFAQVVAETRSGEHRLVLAGGAWDSHDRELRDLAAELGLAGRVITTGYVSSHVMNVLMSACAVFAYVSEYEGFGMPPLEAMVCGAPVVASNTTSLPEVVGDAGIQVDPQDVGAIAGALHRLLTDSDENARRRRLSLERAKLFSWDRTASLTLQSYEAASQS